jgi:hypothetical protein
LFAQGLENEDLRIKALEKLSRERQKNDGEMSIRDIVKYMQDNEESRKLGRAENAKYARPSDARNTPIQTTSGYSSCSDSNMNRYMGQYQNQKSYNNQLQNNQNFSPRNNSQFNKQGYDGNRFAQYQSQQNHQTQGQQPIGTNQIPQSSKQVNFQANSIHLINSRIIGKMIVNDTITKFLCDTGAGTSVISHALVKKLNEEASIKIYQGLPVMSVTGPMKVVGTVKLVCCFGTNTIVRDAEFLVAAEIDESECIVGRDLIKRIPNLNSDLNAMQGTIQDMRIQVEQMQKLRDNEETYKTYDFN